jgi:hypothetical protein
MFYYKKETTDFIFENWGRGTLIVLTKKFSSSGELCFQGDDALDFIAIESNLEEKYPDNSFNDIYHLLWDEYDYCRQYRHSQFSLFKDE